MRSTISCRTAPRRTFSTSWRRARRRSLKSPMPLASPRPACTLMSSPLFSELSGEAVGCGKPPRGALYEPNFGLTGRGQRACGSATPVWAGVESFQHTGDTSKAFRNPAAERGGIFPMWLIRLHAVQRGAARGRTVGAPFPPAPPKRCRVGCFGRRKERPPPPDLASRSPRRSRLSMLGIRIGQAADVQRCAPREAPAAYVRRCRGPGPAVPEPGSGRGHHRGPRQRILENALAGRRAPIPRACRVAARGPTGGLPRATEGYEARTHRMFSARVQRAAPGYIATGGLFDKGVPTAFRATCAALI